MKWETVRMKKALPVGIEDFKEIILKNYYYIDKSLFIKELLDNGSKVSLFTRPRRFGKTLALSMLRYFFEKEFTEEGKTIDNTYLFEDLKIMGVGAEYTFHMRQYPVISLRLKWPMPVLSMNLPWNLTDTKACLEVMNSAKRKKSSFRDS